MIDDPCFFLSVSAIVIREKMSSLAFFLWQNVAECTFSHVKKANKCAKPTTTDSYYGRIRQTASLCFCGGARQVGKTHLDIPLSAHADSHIFKIALLDVGLLGAMLDVPPRMLLRREELFSCFRGALAENLVAQELTAGGVRSLYYWTSSGTAELDFVVQHENRVIPLEAKSGQNVRSKSLTVFGEKYGYEVLSRCSTQNLKKDGGLVNYPLYALNCFPLWS